MSNKRRFKFGDMALLAAGLCLLLAPLIPAALANPSTAEPATPAETPQAGSTAERLLRGEIEKWQRIRSGEYEHALKWKRLVNARTDDAHPVRREGTDYNQAMGRVGGVDGILTDMKRRLGQLEPATPPALPQTEAERSLADQTAKRAERELLASIQSHWQQIRADDWEYAQQQKRIYNQVATESPDWAVDQSGPEYHRAAGRVEIADRFLMEIQQRLDSLDREIAGASPPEEASEPAGHVFPQQPGFYNDGMQISYSVSGAAMGSPRDDRHTTWRRHHGTITGSTLTVSGWVRVGGIGAHVSAVVWAGGQKDRQAFYVENENGSGTPTRFRVSIPVDPDVSAGGFGISIASEYEGGGNSRSLSVDGDFERTDPSNEQANPPPGKAASAYLTAPGRM